MFTAKCKIKLKTRPDKKARRVVGEIIFVAQSEADIDAAIDDLIDHRGAAEEVVYTVSDGKRVVKRGHSV